MNSSIVWTAGYSDENHPEETKDRPISPTSCRMSIGLVVQWRETPVTVLFYKALIGREHNFPSNRFSGVLVQQQ